jgi:peroxiredoxin
MNNKIVTALAFFVLALQACTPAKLRTGLWRGVLKTNSGQEIPFNFNSKDSAGKQQMVIINGSENFKVDSITTKDDSVFIHMPLFDSEFKLKMDGENLTGQWIKHLADKDVPMAFSAQPSTNWRFFEDGEKPAINAGGRWSAIFGDSTTRDTTVGEFRQSGSKLTGTFLTTTGDYRYLEGTVAGKKLYLSCFDGGHAFLFTADVKDAQTLVNGKFYSGASGEDAWTAVKNAKAKLPDAYSLTALKPGYSKVDFTFPDISGKKVRLNDARFKNKVIILQFMGSWCPNCMDETNYLVNYYKRYQPKGVEIIGLAYERSTEFTKSQRTLQQLKNRFEIPYTLLVTGYTNDKDEVAKSLPMLRNFMAFPTTIIIDKKGNVRKIHTGFSGPGTGEHYAEFVTEFEKLTDDLLAER